MICVVDASVALSWIFQDEHSAVSDELLESIAQHGAIVTAIWRLEMANALQMGVRRRRIDPGYRDTALRKLSGLPIEVDSETHANAWTNTLDLAEMHHLTVYDACYLELAVRRKLPLATRDAELANAAMAAGVVLAPTE